MKSSLEMEGSGMESAIHVAPCDGILCLFSFYGIDFSMPVQYSVYESAPTHPMFVYNEMLSLAHCIFSLETQSQCNEPFRHAEFERDLQIWWESLSISFDVYTSNVQKRSAFVSTQDHT